MIEKALLRGLAVIAVIDSNDAMRNPAAIELTDLIQRLLHHRFYIN